MQSQAQKLKFKYFVRILVMKALSIWLLADFTFVIQSYVVSQTLCRIEPKNWDFMGYDIGYEVAKYDQDDETSDSSVLDADREPVLLLNGFGVGSFHQHRLIPELLERNPSRIIYAMDYIGQGRSWPMDCDDGNSASEKDLIYSADLWVNQIISFLEQIVQSHSNGRKVHLVGNSLGGHLAALVASHRPDLVSSITLLNATPVWGLNLPGWSGRLPPPLIPRKLGRIFFDWIRDLRTIHTYLTTAYASSQAFDKVLINQIRECTEGKGGHAAFASILWSPPATYPDSAKTFYDLLSLLQCDVLLLFGQEDPWCKPAFAKRMINSLNSRSISSINSCQACCRYLQLSNVGHCPNHEAPKAVGKVVSTWLRESDRKTAALVDGHDVEVFSEEWGEISLRELDADKIETSWLDRLAATFV
jgi:pimeloyl-ACP methyl ester carboxylesterase